MYIQNIFAAVPGSYWMSEHYVTLLVLGLIADDVPIDTKKLHRLISWHTYNNLHFQISSNHILI